LVLSGVSRRDHDTVLLPMVATSLGTAGPSSHCHPVGHPQPCLPTPGVCSFGVALGASTAGVGVAVPREGTVPRGAQRSSPSAEFQGASATLPLHPAPPRPSKGLFQQGPPRTEPCTPTPAVGPAPRPPHPDGAGPSPSFPRCPHRRVLQDPRQLLHPGAGCWGAGCLGGWVLRG